MNKLINTSFFYCIIGLFAGLFFRLFTKNYNFTGETSLSLIHGHSFSLGMMFFLIVASLNDKFSITSNKKFNFFYYLYNIGLLTNLAIFLIRGICEVKNIDLKMSTNYAISGIAGISHTLIALAFIILFLMLDTKKEIKDLTKFPNEN